MQTCSNSNPAFINSELDNFYTIHVAVPMTPLKFKIAIVGVNQMRVL